MKRPKLLLLATAGVIAIGVIVWLIIQRPLPPQPPFSFIPTSDDLIHWQFELKEEILGVPGSCRIYSFPADFNSICLQADAELLSQEDKEVRVLSSITTTGEEMRLYLCTERVPDTGSARSVRIVNNRISEKRRPDDRYSVRVGWVSVEVVDMALTLPLPQSLVDELNKHIDVNQEM